MPFILFLLIVILIAQIGFWDTLGAVLGAVLMLILLIGLVISIGVLAFLFMLNRLSR